ncbi:PspC domain-containing protein [Sinomonas sp. P47F7]|uniref:PspC domain-containing protein n=1 Tax=Sinomonas sp. P47F7 TaxID=3410987 RepID=UPI003BF5CEB4
MSTEQTPGGPDAPGPGRPTGRAGSDFFGWIRSLGVTRGSDRWAGGVASGLAHRWGVDPVLVRGLFIVATIFLGIGVLAYGVLWLLLPEPDGRIHVQEAMHGRWTAGMTGGLAASILGLGGARAGFWFGEMRGAGPFWAIFWIGVVCLCVFSIARSRRVRRMAGGPYSRGTFAGAPRSGDQFAGERSPGEPFPGAQDGPESTEWHSAGAPSADSPAAGAPGAPHRPYEPAYSGYPGYSGYPAGPRSAGPRGARPYGGPYGPYASRPYGAPRPTAVKPHRRGPGGAFVAVVVGLAVLVAGGLLALQLSGATVLDPSTGALWAIAAAVMGLGILVAGLLGRTGGILSFFAVVALIAAAVTQPAYALSRPRGAVNLAPATVQQATSGYSLTGASGQLDLRQLDTSGPLPSEATVPVNATMSQLEIKIPKNVPVRVQADATMSNVQFGDKSLTGLTTNGSETYNSGQPGATLVINLDATMSNVDIEQEK